jgi:single-stranded-DNA-specific exonuclease
MQIIERKYSPVTAFNLVKEGISPVMAKIYAARGIRSQKELVESFEGLIPYSDLLNAEAAADLLLEAIKDQRRLLIVSDYDADGATACTIGIRGLRAWGANIGYLIPNRLEHGYGLTPEIVRIAAKLDPKPALIITVDNGISSHAGIEEARKLGMEVLVTDHHLPGATLPNARLIVNPNHPDCTFPSKALAGCGVMWYVLWALQDKAHELGLTPKEKFFQIERLLPIVAIGTVADVVALDVNNRILVREGLDQIRQGASFAGIEALAGVSRRDARQLTTGDIAFGVGPRINAAGRLESMDTGVECLLTDDPERASGLAKNLHEINEQRRQIEAETVLEAAEQVAQTVTPDRFTAVAASDTWHKGVIGIVAGRVREAVYRPTFIFAESSNGELTGSGRSIPGFHLRDALDLVEKKKPGLLVKYGGHAMAAGATLASGRLNDFVEAFEAVAREKLTVADLGQQIETDGALEPHEMTLELAGYLRDEVWGQAFPEPSFSDVFRVIESKKMGADGSHLRLIVEKGSRTFTAVRFRHGDAEVPAKIKAVFKLGANTFRGATSLQLLVDHLEPA